MGVRWRSLHAENVRQSIKLVFSVLTYIVSVEDEIVIHKLKKEKKGLIFCFFILLCVSAT